MRIRAPSVTPSVGSDAPIAETLEDDPLEPQIPRGSEDERHSEAPPRAEQPEAQATWVLYVGNLHPRVQKKELFKLFKPFLKNEDEGIRDIILRTSRGCGVTPIRNATRSDRCYATVQFAEYEAANEALAFYQERRPSLRGLKVVVASNPSDLPEKRAIAERTFGPRRKTRIGRAIRRLAVQKTELPVEDEDEPSLLAGPSRKSAQTKARYNPLKRA
ncbi:hypothetical protein BJ322DRAFT_310451 [Thelephora terrestris]|uniref:RRM domain-containing protein n=1 Tax=Thelephora terrestris TaxID=56493 RepID=A0A9P6L2N3_9AGAM|nr:hypothetical protein BJ322DRAFT_310451 [Thelephora terrestris]